MLLKDLVEIESPSGKEERIKSFVKSYLSELGYDVVEDEYFLAINPGAKLIVATHLDTVSVKSKFSTDGTYAYGTGVSDAKASIAAMLEAAEKGVEYTMAFFCDEEEGGEGSKRFAQQWKWGEMAVVMEPTDMKIASRHLGSFDFVVEVRGEEAHASMPHMGTNAIELCCELINRVKEVALATPTKIEGGSDEYIVPGSCRIKFDVLLEIGESVKDVLDRLSFVESYGSYTVSDACEGFESGKVAKILAKAVELTGMKPEYTTMPSWTDAQNLKERYDVVVWGPGELHLCHTARERVKLSDVALAAKVLVSLNRIYLEL